MLYLTSLERSNDLTSAVMLSIGAGFCSALGGVIAVALAGPEMPLHRLACAQAALGAALLFLGCCDLLPEAAAGISLFRTLVFFALGACGSALAARSLRFGHLTRFVGRTPVALANAAARRTNSRRLERPGQHNATEPSGSTLEERTDREGGDGADTASAEDAAHGAYYDGEIFLVGLITFVSLSIHNLLEGMSILFAVQEGMESGIRLAAAISLENVPEGLCIALPLYFATRRKSIAIRMALFSGMMEPLGVLLPGLFLREYLTQTHISSLLAVIAGILVFVALAEMLPLAVKTAGTRTMASLSVWMGGGVLSATIFQPLLMYHARVGMVE